MANYTQIAEMNADPEKMRAAVEGRKKEEEQKYGKNTASQQNSDITPRFILNCLDTNEAGDGVLFAAIQEKKFFFNCDTAEWFRWDHHFWERDAANCVGLAVEDVCDNYAKILGNEAEKAQEAARAGRKEQMNFHEKNKKRLFARIEKIHFRRRRDNLLNYAAIHLAKRSVELDRHPLLLACKSGVIDLRTGNLMPGRPDQFLTMVAPVEWKDLKTPASLWEKTLLEIFDNAQDLVEFLQRLFGYSLTGLVSEAIFPILWGKGRNGKTLLLEVIKQVMGPFVVTLNPETLLDQGRVRNPAGPSPDIMALKGARIALTSETDQDRRLAVSSLKRWTGGDTLTARNPHDRHLVTFSPTHTLFLSTNCKPGAPARDFAFWERVHIVYFPLSFVDRPPSAPNERRAKKGLIEKLIKEESPGILAWLVRGCLKWQRDGLKPPVCVLEQTAQYRREEDILGHFIEERCYLDPEAEVPADDLWINFKDWFEENVSKRGISRRKFGLMMKEQFEKYKKGVFFYRGLRLASGP